ncbi:sulfate/thiosulfate import ATP-binding CysA 2 domain protein, partial [Dickeya phage phiDP10.3]
MLLGTESPSSGQLLLDDAPMPQEPDEHRGVVFQRYSVFPHLSVAENVMLGAEFAEARWLGRVWGKRRRALHAGAMAMLRQVGLEQSAHKYP